MLQSGLNEHNNVYIHRIIIVVALDFVFFDILNFFVWRKCALCIVYGACMTNSAKVQRFWITVVDVSQRYPMISIDLLNSMVLLGFCVFGCFSCFYGFLWLLCHSNWRTCLISHSVYFQYNEHYYPSIDIHCVDVFFLYSLYILIILLRLTLLYDVKHSLQHMQLLFFICYAVVFFLWILFWMAVSYVFCWLCMSVCVYYIRYQ